MIEGSIMAYAKMYISILVVMFLVAVGVFLFQLQQVNHFTQYVNHQIQRHGGLTEEAASRIENYSQEHFNGVFAVSSDQKGERFPYGTVVSYKVTVTLDFIFFNINGLQVPIRGSTVSLVR